MRDETQHEAPKMNKEIGLRNETQHEAPKMNKEIGLRDETQHEAPKMNKEIGLRDETQPTDTSGLIYQTHVLIRFWLIRYWNYFDTLHL